MCFERLILRAVTKKRSARYLQSRRHRSRAVPPKSDFVAIDFAKIFIQSVAKLTACVIDCLAALQLEALIYAQHDLVFADALNMNKNIALSARGHRHLVELIK